MSISLVIGNDTIGYAELGNDVSLKTMTKAMPGGDGSLDFVLPGSTAWKYRNVVVPEARVILRYDGVPIYGGRLACDSMRHRLSIDDDLELSAAGLWAMNNRNTSYSFLAVDTDFESWHQYRKRSDHSGRFDIHTEGYLEIRADKGRTYIDGDAARLFYWIDGGLAELSGRMVTGIEFEVKRNLPSTNWKTAISVGPDPVTAATSDYYLWSKTGGGAVDWETPILAPSPGYDLVDANSGYTYGAKCIMLELWYDGSETSSLSNDPYVRLRWPTGGGGVFGMWEPGEAPQPANRAISITDLFTALGNQSGASVLRIAVGMSVKVMGFSPKFPTTLSTAIGDATLLNDQPMEAYFDLDQEGNERFTANVRPAAVDQTRNRLWSVGERGGEDYSGLQRDWETVPEQIEVMYSVKQHDTFPDGYTQSAYYPTDTTSTFPVIEQVDLINEIPITASRAALYAQMVYEARQESACTGDVTLTDTGLTQDGQEIATVLMRPGDRIAIPNRSDCPENGFYVMATSYDFSTGVCTATIGDPWDPLSVKLRKATKRHKSRDIPWPHHRAKRGVT